MSDTQKHTKPNVPNLRFPEFSGEWERMTIDQTCSLVGGRTPDTNTRDYWNGDIQWFTPSEIGKEKYVSDSNRTISIAGLKNSSAKLLPPNSILLSSRATVGECSINLKECCTNQGFQSAVPNTDITSAEFLYYRLLTHKRDFKKKACGSTFLEISAKQISKLNTCLPTKAEQDKIASLLSLIDERISIQNKVIERYQSLIRALYRHVLPHNGIKEVPLGHLVKIHKGQQLNGDLLFDEGAYYVLNGGTSPSGFFDEYNTPAGTISISEGGNSCGFVKFNYTPFWSGGHCYTLFESSSDKVYYKYLFHYLKGHQENIMALRIGSGLPNIQKKDIESYPILLPQYGDQVRLAKLFDTLVERVEIEVEYQKFLSRQKRFLLSTVLI